jgi:outer membrane protein
MSERIRSESQRWQTAFLRGVASKRCPVSSVRRVPGALVLLLLSLFLAPSSYAEDNQPSAPGGILTLARAIEIALATQPTVLGAQYTVKANEARVGEAQSGYYPQLTGSASYSRFSLATTSGQTTVPATGSTSITGTTGIPQTTPSSTGAFDQYTGSLGLTQIVYDFGKTSSRVQVSKLNRDAARLDLTNARQTVVFNVKQAYYNVLQAKRNADVAQQSVTQFEQHLEQARGLYEVGTKAKFDVTKAEVDLSNARVNLISARNQVRSAFVALKNAIGIPNAPDYEMEDALLYEQYEVPFEDALDLAYARRPDLLAQIKRKESSRESVILARKGYFPVFTANGNYNYSGSDFPLQKGWSYGLNFSAPIFEGFLTRHQVNEAEANLGVASTSEQSLRLDIYSQVQQGYVSLRDAAERIKASDLAIRQARENVDLANGRYKAGVGSPLEVTDAIVARSNAELTHIAALRDYKNAQAAIEKAVGAMR